MRLSSSCLVHALLRQAMRGRAPAGSGLGARSGAPDRGDDKEDQALRPADQATHGDGVCRDTNADAGLRRRSAHGVDVRSDAGEQGTLPAMSAATSACGQNAVSPGTETRSSASPRLATSTYVLCRSSVPTMCSVRMEEIPPYDSGVCTWPHTEASSPAIGPSSPSLASWQYCFIASG